MCNRARMLGEPETLRTHRAQLAGAPNVIAIQGEQSACFLLEMFKLKGVSRG